jgi:hypothetical protein
MPWLDYGINFAMATPSDELMDYHHAMFAPDFLMDAVQNAQVNVGGTFVPLSQPASIIISYPPQQAPGGFLDKPQHIITLFFIFLLGISILGIIRRTTYLCIDLILLIGSGLFGILLCYLSFISVHEFLSPNFNIAWAHPFHLVAACVILFKKQFINTYYRCVIVCYTLFFLCLSFIPQHISLLHLIIPASMYGRALCVFITNLRKQKTIST